MSLKICHISKKYPSSEKIILHDINLEVNDSEFICIIGPSGCGKSTFLNIIAGLEMPTSGKILLDGEPITDAGSDRAVMFQNPALFPWLTVIDNVKFGLKLAGKSKSEQERIAMHYLRLVQLAQYKGYRPHQLSGGMKQRVSLARTLALGSKMLLMDEPFAALDKHTKNMLCDELQSIWMKTKKTVIFVTHSVEEAIFFADRIIMFGATQGIIKKEFVVNTPRPRHIDASDFIELRTDLISQIRKEVKKNAEQEHDNA